MQVELKIPRKLFEHALRDLHRPHPFASERVGFFSTRCSTGQGCTLVHCVEYNSVAEGHYERDGSVGVRIGSAAITEAMGRIMTESVGQIHVHSHGGCGLAGPSSTDSTELPRLSASLLNVDGSKAQGWMILSNDDAWASLSLPNVATPITAPPVSIVGFPISVNRRQCPASPRRLLDFLKLRRRKRGENRYDRQSFLGPCSEKQIQGMTIGILGLGGGGSHFVQQLTHLGFKRFVICDPDVISSSNLNRLVNGTNADVRKKRLKTTIAVRAIKRLHPDASIVIHADKWENATNDLMRCDVVMGSVDSFCARRDIEAFCRRHLIPYIDIGMDVQKTPTGKHQIFGQVITSIPGEPCMHCMGFLNEAVLGLEAQRYGEAGGNPQVVWPNGLLASVAVGLLVDMITDWSGALRAPRYIALKGEHLLLGNDQRLELIRDLPCPHYPLINAGDPVFTAL